MAYTGEKSREYGREWYKRHAEQQRADARAYAAAHPERVRSAGKKSYAKHAEKERADARAYARAHPERRRVAERRWQEKNRERYLATQRARGARRRATEAYRLWRRINDHQRRSDAVGRFTVAEWLGLLAGYFGRCVYCGSTENVGPDHILAIARGGANTIDNIVPACRRCNKSKNARPLIVFLAKRAA